MKIVKGIMVSPGIALGPAFIYSPDILNIPCYDISVGQVPYEIERFQAARGKSVSDIQALLNHREPEIGELERKLLNSHLLMLNDPQFHEEVTRTLKERKKLILVPRETPLSLVHVKNFELLLQAGTTLIPANPSFYTRPQTVEAVVDTVVARVLDHLGIEHQLVARWKDEPE